MKTAFVLSSFFLGSSLFGTIIKPAGVTSTIDGDAGSAVGYLLDDNPSQAAPSLQNELGEEVTLETGDPLEKALATFHFRDGLGHQESWTRSTPEGNPVFVFDLTGGGNTVIGSIVLWQYGNNGGPGEGNGGNATRDFSLIFHREEEGDDFDFNSEDVDFTATMDPILSDVTLPDGQVPGNYAQPFYFGSQSTVRYVALRIDSNYLPPADPEITAGGDRYGLGEVRFATEPAIPSDIPLRITSISIDRDTDPEEITIVWDSVPDRQYTLFYSTDLTDFDANTVAEGIGSTTESTTFTFPNPAPGEARLFFRVAQTPGG